MTPRLALLALSLAPAFPAMAEDAPAPAVTAASLQQPPRIRLFGSNLVNLSLYTAAIGTSDKGELVKVEGKAAHSITPVGSLFAMARKNDNVTIGMPASFATRTLNENTGFGAKPFYREVALVPGQRISVTANFEGYNRRCVPVAAGAGQSRDALRFAPGPTLSFTAEPGTDYEVSFGTDGQGCGITARQLLADGGSTPLRSERQRQRSPQSGKVEGAHLYTFLFRPGSVYYRVTGESANLELQADDAANADAFETAMREIAARPGTQMCIVAPGFDYKSPLLDRLNRVVDEQGKDFPAIVEPIDSMRTVQQTEDHVPTTFMAAVEYCQVAALVAFLGKAPEASIGP